GKRGTTNPHEPTRTGSPPSLRAAEAQSFTAENAEFRRSAASAFLRPSAFSAVEFGRRRTRSLADARRKPVRVCSCGFVVPLASARRRREPQGHGRPRPALPDRGITRQLRRGGDG